MGSIDATANVPDVVDVADAADAADAADPVKDESDGVGDAMENLPQDLGLGKKKKKRKNRLGKTRRAVTGFEEYYADPPTTPAEHAEEKMLYSAEKPFAHRLEEAILRYRQKRRFDSDRSFIFDKYLALGGIDSSQRMFQGLDPEDAKNMNAEEIRQMTSRTTVDGFAGSRFYNPDEPGGWTVNIPLVVKGFLSRWIPENYPRHVDIHDDNVQAAELINNFLSYLQLHDVCPEYHTQIVEARAICEAAPSALRKASGLYRELMGTFNTAAKYLFCDGGAHDVYTSPAVHEQGVKQDESVDKTCDIQTEKLDPYDQFLIFRLSAIAAANDMKHPIVDKDPQDIQIETTKAETYEVISVHRRGQKEMAMWDSQLAQSDLQGKVKAMGTMVLRPSIIEHAYSNVPHPWQIDFSKAPTETFIIDNDVLQKVERGMKMHLEVCRLNIGTVFIKKVLDVRVSFDVLLPQSLMLHWKDPTPNDRPAPSVNDPDVHDGMDCDEASSGL